MPRYYVFRLGAPPTTQRKDRRLKGAAASMTRFLARHTTQAAALETPADAAWADRLGMQRRVRPPPRPRRDRTDGGSWRCRRH